MSTTIFDDLYRAMALFEQFTQPTRIEIWVSEYVPTYDKDGKKIAGWMIPAMGEASEYLPAIRRSHLPETEQILMMNTATFEELKDQIIKAGVPAFRPGGVSILD